MTLLDRESYQRISRELQDHRDVARVAEREGLDEDLLMVIFTHRVTRDATKRFYVVQKEAPKLLRAWDRGTSYLELAREWRFPPVLMAQMVERARQTPKRRFWDAFRRPEEITDARLRREVLEVLEEDWIYSPRGGELQRVRGQHGEARLAAWLAKHALGFRTESDLRGKFAKTPDALLDHPITLEGQRVCWIESKANFGDDVELRRNLRKQLEPYTQMFGEGAVVYWYGHVTGAESPPGILLYDGDTFEEQVPSPWTGAPASPPHPERRVPAPPGTPRPRPASASPVRVPSGPAAPKGAATREPRGPPVRAPEREGPRRAEREAPAPPKRKPRRPADRSAYF